MKKLLFILSLSLFCLSGFSQPRTPSAKQPFTYDLSGGNDTLTTGNFSGFSRLSFQLVSTDLDNSTATIQLQKSNDLVNYLNIVGAVITLNTGTNTNFIEVQNAMNVKYRIIITTNTVTSGTLAINLNAIR